MVTYLQLHHNIVELVVPSAANEFTDVVFTWKWKKKKREGGRGGAEGDDKGEGQQTQEKKG